MHFVQVGNSKFLYRSIRHGGKVCREYLGTGAVAELRYLGHQMERETRRHHHQRCDRLLRETKRTRESLDGFQQWVHSLTKATLVIHGFYQHNRGAWRHRRVDTDTEDRTTPSNES